MRVTKLSVARTIMVLLVSSTDHVTGVAGATLTINESKAGGAFASTSPTVTDRGNGWYSIALLAANYSSLGDYVLRITATGADSIDLVLQVVAYDPGDTVRLGLTALPNAAAEAAGGLYTRGTGAGQISQSTNGQIDVNVERVRNSVIATLTASGYLQTTLMRWLTDNAAGTPSALSANTVQVDAAGIDTVLSATHGPGNWEGGVTATVNQVRDGILNALLSGFAIQGSVGDAIALAAGLLQGNFIMDTVTQDPGGNGQASARIRVFRDAAATNAGTGEFATFTATTTYTGPNQINIHKVVRV